MNRILVVFYSRSGHTEQLARQIAEACGGDLEAIRDRRPRAGVLGLCRSVLEAVLARTPDIEPGRNDPSGYDLVVLGGPVWAGRICSPLRAYVQANAQRLPRVAFFCTQGGSGGEAMFRQIADVSGREPIATLIVPAKALSAGDHQRDLSEFVDRLGEPG